MDLANILSRIRDEYTRRKDNGNNDRVDDSFIDAIGPEISKFFLEILEEENDATLFGALNSFILALYQMSPGSLQFFFRFMTNMKLESMQEKLPRYVSLPLLLFLKGYINALEDATKNKPRATAGDIKAAAEKIAAQARDASSELGKRFNAAKQAAKNFNANKEGPMANPNPKPPPSAGGAGGGSPPPPKNNSNPDPAPPKKRGKIGETLDELKEIAGYITAALVWWGDRGEDELQELARALYLAAVAVLVTAAFAIVAGLSPRDEPMMAVAIATPLVWICGPLLLYRLWRERNERLSTSGPTEDNPHERAGNGVLHIGMFAITLGFLGSVSMLVLGGFYIFASLTQFSRPYVWAQMAAMGVLYFGFVASDVVIDTLKGILQAILPNRFEGPGLSLRNRMVRHVGLIGVISSLLMLYPVLVYVLYYTDYGPWGIAGSSTIVLSVYLGLTAAFANTRLVNEPSTLPPEDLRGQVREFTLKDHRTARSLLLFGATLPTIGLIAFNFLVPPTCETPLTSEGKCPGGYPTYAERWQESDIREIGSRAGSAVTAFFLEEDTATEATATTSAESPADPCDASRRFVEVIKKKDCEVILEAGTDADLIAQCNQARNCGALAPNGRKW